MSKFIHLLDAGHGGMINGIYQTAGKRSPKWEDGSQYFEGVGNRDIRFRLAQMLISNGYDFHFVTTGQEDIDLDDRVDIVNSFCNGYGTDKCILWSIHSNGFKNPDAEGWEVYTTRGTTKSDPIATIAYQEAAKLLPDHQFRSDKRDGDVDKEANFYIIANTKCRAVLTENLFHTNPRECKLLLSPEGRQTIALAHFRAIERVEQEISI